MTEMDRRAESAAAVQAAYQVATIDGVDVHVFPINARGRAATSCPHNNRLNYGHRHVVTADARTIAGYSRRAFVLNGFSPVIDPDQSASSP